VLLIVLVTCFMFVRHLTIVSASGAPPSAVRP
jgi:hypothetical protein